MLIGVRAGCVLENDHRPFDRFAHQRQHVADLVVPLTDVRESDAHQFNRSPKAVNHAPMDLGHAHLARPRRDRPADASIIHRSPASTPERTNRTLVDHNVAAGPDVRRSAPRCTDGRRLRRRHTEAVE